MVDELTENTVWWDGNRKQSQEHFDNLLARLPGACEGQDAVRAGPLRRRRSEVPHQGARLHRIAWHSLFIRQLLIRPERAELASFVPDMTIIDMPSFKPDPKRHGGREGSDTHGRDRLHPQDRADLRLVLRRRDEEVGVHHAQLLSAGAGRDADALLGQRRQGRRQRAVLRPLRHRQDHAVGRSEPHPDRRRRDRLVAARHLQFRRRLLRQDHQALARSRAEDLGRHQPLRRRAGERRVRSGDAHPGLRQRQARPRTRARPIRSTSSRTPRAPAWPAIRRTSSS